MRVVVVVIDVVVVAAAAAAAVQPGDAVCSNHCLVDNIFEIDTLTKAIEDA